MGTINLRFLAIATLTAAAVAVGSLSYLAYQSSPERDSNDDNDIDANEPKKPETKDCINNLTENVLGSVLSFLAYPCLRKGSPLEMQRRFVETNSSMLPN